MDEQKPRNTVTLINNTEYKGEIKISLGKTLVTITEDGRVVLGEDTTLDEAAKAFWEQVARLRPNQKTNDDLFLLQAQVRNVISYCAVIKDKHKEAGLWMDEISNMFK